ncbi:MAG TPA: hypothetical protein VGF60_24630 [Xanthobacteraceae bacterium]|jgi:hypothetical protein
MGRLLDQCTTLELRVRGCAVWAGDGPMFSSDPMEGPVQAGLAIVACSGFILGMVSLAMLTLPIITS